MEQRKKDEKKTPWAVDCAVWSENKDTPRHELSAACVPYAECKGEGEVGAITHFLAESVLARAVSFMLDTSEAAVLAASQALRGAKGPATHPFATLDVNDEWLTTCAHGPDRTLAINEQEQGEFTAVSRAADMSDDCGQLSESLRLLSDSTAFEPCALDAIVTPPTQWLLGPAHDKDLLVAPRADTAAGEPSVFEQTTR